MLVTMLAISLPAGTFAQDEMAEEEKPHLFTMTTTYLASPEDGSQAEFDSLNALFNEKVTKVNAFIVSQTSLFHRWGSDNRQYVTITEYASWSDVEKAQEMNTKLFNSAWPTEEAREAFNKASEKYFGWHSDEIYVEDPNAKK